MVVSSCPDCALCGQVILYGISFFGETPLHEDCLEKLQADIHEEEF